MQDKAAESGRLKKLLRKEERGVYGYRPGGAGETQAVIRGRRKGRPSRLKKRGDFVLKMLEDGRRLTRKVIMDELHIRRKATFYEIVDSAVDSSGQFGIEHDKAHDVWFLAPVKGRRRTMSQCRELNLLIGAIKDERLDFYIPRAEYGSLIKQAVNDPNAEYLSAEESFEDRGRFVEHGDEVKWSPEEAREYFERKYGGDKRLVRPLLEKDRNRERGAIYWHVEPVEKKPDGKKLSKVERKEIREVDQPKIKRLLEKCGPMSPDRFMYLIPEAFLLCLDWVDKEYLSGKRSLAKMSDEELARVRREAFGRTKRISIVYSFDVDEAFEWFKRKIGEPETSSPPGRSLQVEFRNRLKEIGAGVKAAERWSEKEKKPRIYQQHREPSAKYYPTRREVTEEEKAAGDRFGEKFSRQDEERARRRLSAERRSRSLSDSKEGD